MTEAAHKHALRKAWTILTPQERRLAWIVLVVVLFAAVFSVVMVGAVMPFLAVLSDPALIERTPALAWAYATFGFESKYTFLVALGIGSFLIIVFSSLVQITRNYAVVYFSQNCGYTVSLRLLGRYLRQPYAFFLDRHSGDMSTRLLSEVGQAINQFYKPAADMIASTLTMVLIVGFLLWVNWAVTLVAFLVLGGAYVLVYWLVRLRVRELGRVRLNANRLRFRLAGEAFGGVKELKVKGYEAEYEQRFDTPSRDLAQAMIRIQVLSNIPQILLQAVAFGGIILLCLVMLSPEDLAAGTGAASILPLLGVFAFAGQRLMPEMGKMYGAVSQIQSGIHALNALYDDLIGEQAAPRPATTAPAAAIALNDRIVMDKVTFHYPKAERPGLDNISIEIPAGAKIAIVGSTGAGKTTLADVVLGLLHPTEGKILVDGVAVVEGNKADWQKEIGYVPQDIFLIDATVAENIAFGTPPEKIRHDDVERAARIARIHDFIGTNLPDGYQTHIGERGVRLSGGQRQRLGIARALYDNPSLIVFDEATSALDNLTEAEVMEAIDALPRGKTVLMVAHRLSSVRRCEKIIVLEHGRVAAMGPWDELVDSSPAFRTLLHAKSE